MGQGVGKEAPLVGKRPEKGRKLEGRDWISMFLLINHSAALEDCYRLSEAYSSMGGSCHLSHMVLPLPSLAFFWQFSGVGTSLQHPELSCLRLVPGMFCGHFKRI